MATLDRIFINNFRGIRDCSLGDLGKLNLLVGAGNAGKTSILEALAVFSAPLDINEWGGVARTREVRGFLFSDSLPLVDAVRWLFPHVEMESEGEGNIPDTHAPISIDAQGEVSFDTLRATCEYIQGSHITSKFTNAGKVESVNVEDNGWLIRSEIKLKQKQGTLFSDVGDDLAKVEYPLWRQASSVPKSNSGPKVRSVYLAPYSHRNQPQQLSQFSKASASDQKSTVIELMQDLDPKVRDIEIITDVWGDRPILAIRHKRLGLAPISTFGDGFRRALMIALAIPHARGGFLLVDEIEAALHFTALGKVMSWLVRACERYDVQIFATTHSLEAIDAVATASKDMTNNPLAAFHLERQQSTVSARRYSESMLLRLVHEGGLDIR